MRNKFFIILLVIVVLSMQFDISGEVKTDVSYPIIIPDSQIQEQISHTMNAESENDFFGQLAKLKEMGGEHHEKLLPQLIYYSMHAEGESVKVGMTPAVIIGKLKISKSDILKAILPYLETKDASLKHELYGMLGVFTNTVKDPELDFSGTIVAFIKETKKNPPLGLIKYMYENSPSEALLSLMDIYMKDSNERERIIQSGKIISSDIEKRRHGPIENRSKVDHEAIRVLSDLSQDKEWWVRLYVAEILRQNPEFRSSEIVERLEKDEHPLVHEDKSDILKMLTNKDALDLRSRIVIATNAYALDKSFIPVLEDLLNELEKGVPFKGEFIDAPKKITKIMRQIKKDR